MKRRRRERSVRVLSKLRNKEITIEWEDSSRFTVSLNLFDWGVSFWIV